MEADEHTCVRRFKITSGMGSDLSSSLLSPPIKIGDVVGRGVPGLVMVVKVLRKELEGESVTLLGVAVGVGEEMLEVLVRVLVLVGGRLEDELRVEVGGTAGMVEVESGRADCTDLDESSPQTN